MKKWKKMVSMVLAGSMCSLLLLGCTKSGGTETKEEPAETVSETKEENDNAETAEETAAETDQAEEKEESSAENAEFPQGDWYIGFSNFSIGNSWRVQMEAEFTAYADQLKAEGVIGDYVMMNSDGDVSKQIADVRDLISMGVDAICITSASPTALAAVCEEAEEAGVKVISFNEIVDSEKLTCILNQDEYQRGYESGKWLAETMGGSGNIVCINGIAGTANDEQRFSGCKDALKDYPDINILTETYADWDYATAKAAMQDIMSAYPDIDGIFAQGSAATQAVVDTYAEANMEFVPVAYGEDNNGFLKVWNQYADQGLKTCATTCPVYCSAYALQMAVRVLNGETVDPYYDIPLVMIEPENIGDYVREDLPDSYWADTWLDEDALQKLFQ